MWTSARAAVLAVVWTCVAGRAPVMWAELPPGRPSGLDPLLSGAGAVLCRMDQAGDGDGVLRRDEIPRGAESFVVQFVNEAGLDPAKPVVLSKLAAAVRSSESTPSARLSSGRIGNRPGLRVAVGHAADTGSSGNTRQYAASLLQLYDADQNGALEREEWTRLGDSWGEGDRNCDGKLSLQELADRMAGYAESPPGQLPPRRFRGTVPDWLAARDADGDGQVMMWEFSRQWTESKVAEFYRYDLNCDGVITPKEYRQVLQSAGGEPE